MLAPFVALTRKDVKLFFGNRRALLMSVVAPIAIASFFGYLYGGSGATEPSRIPVLAVDQDGSAISREIAAALAADKNLDVKPSALDPAREAVRKGRATVAFVIPPGRRSSTAPRRSRRSRCSTTRRTAPRWGWCRGSSPGT